jgi:hypothetical protein
MKGLTAPFKIAVTLLVLLVVILATVSVAQGRIDLLDGITSGTPFSEAPT